MIAFLAIATVQTHFLLFLSPTSNYSTFPISDPIPPFPAIPTRFMSWFIKLRNTLSHAVRPASPPPPTVGVLAFEIAATASKLIHLYHSLSEKSLARLRENCLRLEGVRKIVSDDDTFLLRLACAELAESLRLSASTVARLGQRCREPGLRCFDRLLHDFADSGRDPHGWLLSTKEMEAKLNKLDRFVASAGSVRREMDELVALENALKKTGSDKKTAMDLKQKIVWQRQHLKYVKETSVCSRSFDTVLHLLARIVFTIVARIKLVFGFNRPISLPRSLSASALVYPSDGASCFVSGPLPKTPANSESFFDLNSKILRPPPTTLGSAALSLHYSNLIIVIEKMIRSPQLVGVDARDDLYSMLPQRIRAALRCRLKGRVGLCSCTDPALAAEWRDALQRILGWLAPLAHNMIRWQSERSFEQQSPAAPKMAAGGGGGVLLLQTLQFANQDKAEAAITELLVGLNYVWRFEREMNAKAIFLQSSINGRSKFSSVSY